MFAAQPAKVVAKVFYIAGDVQNFDCSSAFADSVKPNHRLFHFVLSRRKPDADPLWGVAAWQIQ